MTELKDIAKEYDGDLENCVVFIRGNDDILAVDISTVRKRITRAKSKMKENLKKEGLEV